MNYFSLQPVGYETRDPGEQVALAFQKCCMETQSTFSDIDACTLFMYQDQLL